MCSSDLFAARIARDIQGLLPSPRVARWSVKGDPSEAELAAGGDGDIVEKVREAMSRDVGVVRDAAGLGRALDLFDDLERRAPDVATRNTLIAARLIAAAALARTESRGGHFRADFPVPDPAQARRTFLTLAEARAISARSAEPRAAS